MATTKRRVIVIAVDPKCEETPSVIRWTLENIIRPEKDRVELVSGWSVESEMDAIELGGEYLYVGQGLAEAEKETEEQLLQELTLLAQPLCDNGVDCHVSLIKGHRSPGNMIVDFTDRAGATMLVLGSRGLSYWRRFFVGSFSDFCHHSAKCPVLVVKNVSATGQTKTSAAEPESSVTTQVQDNVVDAL